MFDKLYITNGFKSITPEFWDQTVTANELILIMKKNEYDYKNMKGRNVI